MAAPVLRPLTIGDVLDVSFGLYRSLFYPLVIVAAACRMLPLLLNLYLQPTTQDPGAAFAMLADRWPLLLGSIALAVVANGFAVAAATSIVAAAYLGQAITANAALARAAGVIGRVVIASILMGISIMLGLIVLIVPGVILLCGLALTTAALVLEPGLSPTAAMGRSWELTSGFRAKVFATLLVAYLFLLVPTMIVGVVAGIGTMLGPWPVLLTAIVTGILQILVYPFLYVVVTVLYYDLRVRKEGLDLELLATATPATG